MTSTFSILRNDRKYNMGQVKAVRLSCYVTEQLHIHDPTHTFYVFGEKNKIGKG